MKQDEKGISISLLISGFVCIAIGISACLFFAGVDAQVGFGGLEFVPYFAFIIGDVLLFLSRAKKVAICFCVAQFLFFFCLFAQPVKFVHEHTPFGVAGEADWKVSDQTLIIGKEGERQVLYKTGGEFPWMDTALTITRVEFDGVVEGQGDFSNFLDVRFFFGRGDLSEIDLTGFDTSGITNMSGMFTGVGVESFDLSNFDTSNVTNMRAMFNGCHNLQELDLSSFDTSNVSDMGCMFDGCQGLKKLDISGFDTSNVKDMQSLFKDCESLTTLDLSGVDTGSVENMAHMFDGCKRLKELDVSGFDTFKVKRMSEMFACCESLTKLDLSHFDMNKVEFMDGMFSSCKNLEHLTMPRFDTSHVIVPEEMTIESLFGDCDKLEDKDKLKEDLNLQ